MTYQPPGSLMDDGAGIPSWSFKDAPVGTVKVGTVLETEWRQAKDYKTNELQWWNPGEKEPSTTKLDGAEPVWQYVVTLQTDERDGSDDDGRRRDYVKRGRNGTQLLQQAVKDAGLSDLVFGAKYMRKLTGTEPSSNPKYDDRKTYAWKIEAPVASLNDFDAPAQQPAQQPAPQPAPQPVAAGPAASDW